MNSIDHQRRDFLHTCTASFACLACSGALAALLESCYPGDNGPTAPSISVDSGNPVIDLTKEPSLQQVGGAVKKRYSRINGGSVIVVVRTSTSAFIALSAVCTHQGFEVNLPANGIIVCPGHGSRFNASTGAVVQGPAGTALPKFTATYDVNAQTVTIG